MSDARFSIPIATYSSQIVGIESFPHLLLLSSCLLGSMAASSATVDEPKVILVSIDGLRWQEVFYGADQQIATDSRFVKDRKKLQPLLQGARARQLMPFFHQTIAKQGLLVGDRHRGCRR